MRDENIVLIVGCGWAGLDPLLFGLKRGVYQLGAMTKRKPKNAEQMEVDKFRELLSYWANKGDCIDFILQTQEKTLRPTSAGKKQVRPFGRHQR